LAEDPYLLPTQTSPQKHKGATFRDKTPGSYPKVEREKSESKIWTSTVVAQAIERPEQPAGCQVRDVR